MPAATFLPENAREVLIAVNPHAGIGDRRAKAEELAHYLREQSLSVTIATSIDELADRASQTLSAGTLRAVVAAGGDGTVSLIANRTPPGTPLAILPLGTENLLAKHLETSADTQQLCRVISAGCCVSLDAGQAGGRIFTLMAGCGFDADVVRRLHRHRTGNIHHLSYAKPILDSIRTYEYPELRVRYELPESCESDQMAEIAARWVFVVNLPRYAGGLSFAPQASGTDGLLDVCTFKEGSLWSGLVYLSGVMLGQHESMQDFARVRTRRLTVGSAGPAPYQLDGDPGGDLPVEIRALPGRLTLLVTGQWAERHGFEIRQ
jgi:Sphingosine kinase and enzymes related to eukaryotic diacylglycerol kinase